MAKKTIKGTGKNYVGTPKADKLTVKGNRNTVSGAKGNDTIILSSGTGHKFYGRAGNDTFVITKDSTGTAVVKDYGNSKGNKDKLKISGGVVKSIVVSGNNLKFTGGKSAAITFQENTKNRTVLITDSRGSWKVAGGNTITLGKNFNGTMDVRKYLTTANKLTIDASAVTKPIDIIGSKAANSITLGKADGGTCQGMAGDDIFLLSAGNYHTVYGDDKAGKLTGKDTIMVQVGSKHKLYGGKGADTIYLFKGAGDESTLDGGAGNDTIAIESSAGTGHTVNGGAGADQIFVDSGKNVINGGSGNDWIKLGQKLNGSTSVKDVNRINGDSGNDSISLSYGKSHIVETGSGKDVVGISTGGDHYITNYGGGNDEINVGKSAGDDIYIYGDNKGTSRETVRINGGNSHTVRLYKGDDTITVSAGTGHEIHADEGNDSISVSGGHSHKINGWEGNDVINVKNVKGSGNGYSVSNNLTFVSAGSGNDTITVNNSRNVQVSGESGTDNISVTNSNYVYVEPYTGGGKVRVESCQNTKVALSPTPENGSNYIYVTGTGNNVVINMGDRAKDNITVDWRKNFGYLEIDAARTNHASNGNKYVDSLKIDKYNINYFSIKKSGSYDLAINGNDGGSILIKGFHSYDDDMSFIGGINFNGTNYSYNYIKDLAGYK